MVQHKIVFVTAMLMNLIFINGALAHNKVVVVPLGGDEATPPQFRIIGTGGSDGKVFTGRLEFTADTSPDANSLWGTVCDDVFDHNNNAASAICQDLGFTSGGAVVGSGSVTDGAGFIILDEVLCPNGADSFSDCTHNPYNVNNCAHNEDVGVTCIPNAPPMPLDTNIEFRIIAEPGGAGAHDGRLEARSLDSRFPAWGTVCDDLFQNNNNAANAICQDLGYDAGVVRSSVSTTDGVGQITLDDVLCPGTATTYTDCTYNFIQTDCSHAEDVGVTCSN